MKEVQAELSDGGLILSWGRETTTVHLDEVQEIYVLRLEPDAPTASEDQTILLVESSTFVGLRAYSPGLLGAIEDRLEALREQGRVFQVRLSGLPWKWKGGIFTLADMKPTRRPIAELERMKQKDEWEAAVPPVDEELFPL